MAYRKEDIPDRLVRVIGAERTILAMAATFAVVLHQMISNDRMDFHLAKEAAFGFDDAEEQNTKRDTDRRVDTVFDAGKDGHKDTSKEDDDFQRRDAPELVKGVWRGDQVSNGVDDDS